MARISRERVEDYVITALRVIMENDNSLRSRDVFREVGNR